MPQKHSSENRKSMGKCDYEQLAPMSPPSIPPYGPLSRWEEVREIYFREIKPKSTKKLSNQMAYKRNLEEMKPCVWGGKRKNNKA